jgi:hypothetical protein
MPATTIDNLAFVVQQRLEETGFGQFWSLENEIRIFIVEAMCECALITGQVQVKRTPAVALVENSVLQVVPDDIIALSKIENQQGAMMKTSIDSMDRMRPNWRNDIGPIPLRWFSFGMTKFGVWPKVTVPVNVVLYGLAVGTAATPLTTRPYAGTEPINFPTEYNAGLINYASAIARMKEGGSEVQQAVADYDFFLSQMLSLSRMAIRTNTLRFSKAMGFPARPVDTEAV